MLDLSTRLIKETILNQYIIELFIYFTPNQVTLLSGLCGLISCYYIIYNNYTYALIYWLVNRLLDGIDGMIFKCIAVIVLYITNYSPTSNSNIMLLYYTILYIHIIMYIYRHISTLQTTTN